MAISVPGSFKHGDLTEFRAAVARLKKEGLIPPNSRGKIVNVRTARPGDSFGGMTLRDRVKRYVEVADGRAVTIAKSRVKDTQGFKVAKKGLKTERVIVPTSGEVSVEKGNIVIRHRKDSAIVKRVMLSRKNLKQYLSGADELPDLKGNKWYAFYAYQGKSKQVFRTGQQLHEYLMEYRDRDSYPGDTEFFRNIEIVETIDKRQWEEREYKSSKHSGKRKKMKDFPPSKQEQLRAKKREYMREYRRKHGVSR